ncbi:hypothetical protein ACH3VR_06725 [Microbacterium sp. B2969]|uniref:DNA mismatch repair protein n=1 Tax=Microbacterium alkaliflavum TaxID=3248839 RepID=A0ABW7Q733_9MICO
MTTLTDDLTTQAPALQAGTPVRLAAAAPGLWRVLDARGLIIGHLESLRLRQGVRYRARRFHSASRTFRDLGDFWSPDDAVDCLRFAR